MKKLCEACEDSGFCVETMRLICHPLRNHRVQVQSSVAPDSVPGSIKSTPQKSSRSSSVNGSPGLRSGDNYVISTEMIEFKFSQG